MTMVLNLRRRFRPARVAGAVMCGVLAWIAGDRQAAADPPPVHYHHAGIMPPGAIGTQQLRRGGPLPGYFQPVEIRGPEGSLIAPAAGGGFEQDRREVLYVGLHIGNVYRLRVTNIPNQEGVEVYPTIELIDRLYPPIGQEFKFPIPIELTQEELEMAASGKFVTRVVYLEDPDTAMPVARESDEQAYFEVQRGDDPLAVADSLGRPMAIVRMGARVPDADGPDAAFLYGCPPLIIWNPRQPQQPELLMHAQTARTPAKRLAPAANRRVRQTSAIERTPRIKRTEVVR
jgi:hypothetical protein